MILKLKVGISFICFSAWKNIEWRRSFPRLLLERTKIKQGRKQKQDNTQHWHSSLFSRAVLSRHHASFAHEQRHKDGCLSAPFESVTLRLQDMAEEKKAPEYSRFHVYQTVTHDNVHKGGVLHDGAVRVMTHKKINTLKWSAALLSPFVFVSLLPSFQAEDRNANIFFRYFIHTRNKQRKNSHSFFLFVCFLAC